MKHNRSHQCRTFGSEETSSRSCTGLAIRGNGTDGNHRFRAFWARKYPDIKLDWKKIGRAIADNTSVLPDRYDYGPERLRQRFRGDLCSFARQLTLTDPQD